MRWPSHILIAGAVCAVANPFAVPAAVLGSTAPDWLEPVLSVVQRRRVRHRGVTHHLTSWLTLAAFAVLLWDWRGWVLWFALGGAMHWMCDALTISGAPVHWWSDRRATLFGGRVRTGGPSEYVVTGVIVATCAAVAWWRRDELAGFIPYFMNWPQLYESGVIDAFEWRAKRWELL
jgi:inner membrane protein